jgi:Zn-finger nucleic acid-binding protein
MSNIWDEKRKASEEAFFKKENEAALKRLSERPKESPRLSPVTGEPMIEMMYMGVVIDKCPKSGGIWLDDGELEHIINALKKKEDEDRVGYLDTMLDYLRKKN